MNMFKPGSPLNKQQIIQQIQPLQLQLNQLLMQRLRLLHQIQHTQQPVHIQIQHTQQILQILQEEHQTLQQILQITSININQYQLQPMHEQTLQYLQQRQAQTLQYLQQVEQTTSETKNFLNHLQQMLQDQIGQLIQECRQKALEDPNDN